jgi:DNA processing protein
LYAKGRVELLNAPRALAIVGSRNATAQGIKNTEWFAEELAQGGCQIVSGLALGIDAAAHRGALTAQRNAPGVSGSTIAVIGTGCDIIYPARNRELTYAIAEQGVILSEFPLGAKAQPSHFPRRNRIISGLSQGVLVVEAAMQSGSLITARQALEQNREVFAIPGSIHSPLSKGCHELIKQGAKLVECAQDILSELRPVYPSRIAEKSSVATSSASLASIDTTEFSPSAQKILNALGHDPCDLDTLSRRVAMDVGDLLAEMMVLELSGLVEKRAGQIYAQLFK